MPSTTTTTIQHGVRYQDGTEDWDTARWYGTIDIPQSRETFREQYNLRLASFGLPPMALTFLTRTVTTEVSEAHVVDDSVPAPVPEPEVVPDVDAPVADDVVPAAPDEEVEPPTDGPPVEGELPENADILPATDDEGVLADGK